MNKLLVFVLLFFGLNYTSIAQERLPNGTHRYNHNLNLSDWGPYTKKYIGVSHVADNNKGVRFDLSAFPGFYRKKVEVPNVFFESGFHPWQSTPDLEFFTYRHQLEWKDKVYSDISYFKLNDEGSRLIRMEMVNNTNLPQSLVMNFMASIHFPSIGPYKSDIPIEMAEVVLPKNASWIDAIDYSNIEFSKPKPSDNLITDGQFRGEIRDHGFVLGRGIGQGFGVNRGDHVMYDINSNGPISKKILLIRCRIEKNRTSNLKLEGITNGAIAIMGTGDFQLFRVPLEINTLSKNYLKLTSIGNVAIQLDGFIIVNENEQDTVQFHTKKWNHVPQIIHTDQANSIILKYDGTDNYYGINWNYDDFVLREVFAKDLDIFYKRATNSHVSTKLYGEGEGHFTNVFMNPISLSPNSKKVIYGQVHVGTLDEVRRNLESIDWSIGLYDKKFTGYQEEITFKEVLDAGKPFLFSQQIFAATLATNIVYPVYTQKEYIKHRTPGRWWDTLYTWDSGFIGLGLLEQSVTQSIENLEVYLMNEDDQSAFLHHGSPVPVQLYLFKEIWDRTQSIDFLRKYYPGLKRYHEFLAGRMGSSTTNALGSDLLKTWDYFYNSGGWDDYPPQFQVHKDSLEKTVTPVINTSHAIRTAKILKQAALLLGYNKDVSAYDKDIKKFSNALQKYSWDENSGYFGYVTHSKNGKPNGILRTVDGENFNKGLDGIYPLLSGICTSEQKEILLKHLKTKGEIWSDIGLSAVDQSASYYKNDGYWNGTVWMPHQWFFYKTMLDEGEGDFAFKIADIALKLWKQEADATYNSSEHFVIETGRGAGWQQFGGLSSPVASWFSSYYKKGTITTGYDIWIKEQHFSDDYTSVTCKLLNTNVGKGKSSIVVVLKEANYDVSINGAPVTFTEITKGCLNIDVPKNIRIVELKISVINTN